MHSLPEGPLGGTLLAQSMTMMIRRICMAVPVVSLTWVIVLTSMVHVCLSVDAQVVRQLVIVNPHIRLKRLQLDDDIKEAGGQVALAVRHGTSLGHILSR